MPRIAQNIPVYIVYSKMNLNQKIKKKKIIKIIKKVKFWKNTNFRVYLFNSSKIIISSSKKNSIFNNNNHHRAKMIKIKEETLHQKTAS